VIVKPRLFFFFFLSSDDVIICTPNIQLEQVQYV